MQIEEPVQVGRAGLFAYLSRFGKWLDRRPGSALIQLLGDEIAWTWVNDHPRCPEEELESEKGKHQDRDNKPHGTRDPMRHHAGH